MTRLLGLIVILSLALSLGACGKRGKLDAPEGAAADAPDLPSTKPFPKPIGGNLPTPTSSPSRTP